MKEYFKLQENFGLLNILDAGDQKTVLMLVNVENHITFWEVN